MLDFGPGVTNPFRIAINNNGIISGTQGDSLCDGATAFRFDTRTGQSTLLEPLSTAPAAWGLDINSRGDVLGYSFECGGRERIGVWNNKGQFQAHFVEGTEQIPTISNELVFNDRNLVVITMISSPDDEQFRDSYLVPRPGTRLSLADLVQDGPADLNVSSIRDINNHGDMIGFDLLSGGTFLLKRTGATGN